METPQVIKRLAAPSKLDIAPYGTKCVVIGKEGEGDIYIQNSNDEDNPNWVHIGNDLKETA